MAFTKYIGANTSWLTYWAPDGHMMGDAAKTRRTNPAVDAEGWPTADFNIDCGGLGSGLAGSGYLLRFNGDVDSISWVSGSGTIGAKNYDAGTNTTSYSVTFNTNTANLHLSGTKRTGPGGTSNTGVTNLRLIRPGHTAADGANKTHANSLKTAFSLLRFMTARGTSGVMAIMGDEEGYSWAARKRLPGQGAGDLGLSWEDIIIYCNSAGIDPWITLPYGMKNGDPNQAGALGDYLTDDYITKVAQIFKYGSDGVNPYTSPQANPKYPPLDPSRKLYVEYCNELWNGTNTTPQPGSAFQTSSFNKCASTAEFANGDPYHYAGTANGWYDVARTAYTLVRISLTFRSVFGDADMMTRVRPIFSGQAANSQVCATGLDYIDSVWGPSSPHSTIGGYAVPKQPVSYYVYGLSYAPYIRATTIAAMQAECRAGGSKRSEMDAHNTLAASYDIKATCYEGGHEIYNPTQQVRDTLSDPAMRALYRDDYLGYFYSLPQSDVFCHYTAFSTTDGNGAMFGLSNDISDTSTQRWLAYKDVAAPVATMDFGTNLNWCSDWDPEKMAADLMWQARPWALGDGNADASPWAPVDSQGWPVVSVGTTFGAIFEMDPWPGVFKLSFKNRNAGSGDTVTTRAGANVTLTNRVHDAGSNVTTYDVVVPSFYKDQFIWLMWAGNTGGVTDVHLMRPLKDGSGWHAIGTPFSDHIIDRLAAFSTIRLMQASGSEITGGTDTVWAGRTKPWSSQNASGDPGRFGGLAIENRIAMANQANKDLWINTPFRCDADYILKTAQALKYGTDGVNPYTSPQANPVFPPLAAHLKVYIEHANEIWNSSWGYPANENYNLNNAEMAAGNPNQIQSSYTGSGAWGQSWQRTGWLAVRNSLIFRQVFGDADMMTRVRPVLATQHVRYATTDEPLNYIRDVWGPSSPYNVINGLTNPKRAQSYYLFALATAPYIPGGQDTIDVTSAETMIDSAVADLNQTAAGTNVPAMTWNKSRADAAGIQYVAYEGGANYIPELMTGGATAETIQKAKDAHYDPVIGARMGANLIGGVPQPDQSNYVYGRLFQEWSNAGGGLFCHYTLSQGASAGGLFGLCPPSAESTSDPRYEIGPKWDALKAFADIAASPPTITLSTSALTFNGYTGGSNPAAQNVIVYNMGGGVLAQPTVGAINYGSGSGWLSASVAGNVVTVSAALGALAAGTYTASFQVSSAGALGSPQTVNVSFVVTSSLTLPIIQLSSSLLNFNATAGSSSPNAQTIAITNGGSGSLAQPTVSAVHYNSGSGWLSVSIGGTTVTVSPSVGSLAAGTYSASFTVASAGAFNTPQTVNVIFVVAAEINPSTIAVTPSSLAFSSIVGEASPDSKVIAVSNSGGGALVQPTVVGTSETWLSAVFNGLNLVVSINNIGLAVGSHSGFVTINSTGATNTPFSIPVTVTVAEAGTLPVPDLSPAGNWVVNLAPGKSVELYRPMTPVFFGVRATPGNIRIGDIYTSFGLSNIRNHGHLPESDSLLNDVLFTAPEWAQPLSGVVTKSITAGSLVLTKTNDTDYEQGIYEVSDVPTLTGSSAAYFRFKKKSWASFSPSWLGRPGTHGLYFALRDGNMNTGAFVFLQANGTVVLAGPVRSNGSRYVSTSTPTLQFPALANDQVIELWIIINRIGLTYPYEPSHVPVVEVWGALADGAPVLLHREPVANLGISGRRFTEQKSTIFFGNAGRTGDVLDLIDWQLYPDFRMAIREFEKMPDHSAVIYPDAPETLWARDGKMPTESIPARWFEIDGGLGAMPETSFVYQPGRKLVPQMFRISKSVVSSDITGYERDEPLLGVVEENPTTHIATKNGFLFEAFMASTVLSPDNNVFGSGFSVEDGSRIYRVATLAGGVKSGYGIHNGGPVNDFNGYYGSEHDLNVDSLKVVRLVADPHADKVYLDVDDFRVVSRRISTSTIPGSTAKRVRFGHLASATTLGHFDVASLLYVPNYETWDAQSTVWPTDPPYASRGWVQSLGGAGNETGLSEDNSYLTIKKGLVNTAGSHSYFMKDTDFPDYPGIVVDFGMKVHSYADYRGEVFAPVTQVGAGVKIWYGRRLELGFYSCGTAGRFIGIIPVNGNSNDIINQTELGRKFSAQVDWTEFHNYRIILRSFKSIEVWVDGFHTEPAIVIPWNEATTAFDIPLDVVPPRVAFGHFGSQESSITWWKHFNIGGSNGYDIALTQSYPEGVKPYHFDGKSLLFFSAKDTTDP